MTEQSKKLAIRAIESYKGDDLQRMRLHTRNMTPAQMAQPFGVNGETNQSCLDKCLRHVDECDQAIREIQKVLPSV